MKKLLIFALISLMILISMPSNTISAELDPVSTREYGVDLAYNRRVVSIDSPDENYNYKAVDGDSSTRYASPSQDDVFFYVDLGSVEKVGKVVIDWEAAYASEYKILLSLDGIEYTEVANVTNTEPTVDEIVFPTFIEAQFVKFQGVSRGTGWGYSFYSFEVYGPKSLAVDANVEVVSSNEHETELNKNNMVDNIAKTRWASLASAGDDQYFIVDLEDATDFDLIKIRWEVSFARIYRIYKHDSLTNTVPSREDAGWEEIYETSAGLGEVETMAFGANHTSRYLKVELVQRETSENTKKTGRLPWQSTFSIYSFELFDWSEIHSIPLGNVLEYSYNSPAWVAGSNLTLNPTGLLLAPIGYPIEAVGEVTNLESIADGDIPGFESYATYNPAIIYDEDLEMFHMIYRAELPDNFEYYFMGDGRPKYELGHMSTLAYAYSYDGVNFYRGGDNPIAWPTTADERGGGIEDPRMFKIENDPNRGGLTTYYITYTMYDNSITREGIIYTHDFVTFNKVGRLAPDYQGAIKSGTYVTDPEGNAVKITDPRPGKTGKVYIIYMKDGGYTRIGFTDDVLRIEAEDIIDIDTSNFGLNDIEDITKGNESCMAITNIYGEDDEDIYLMYGGGRLSDENIQYQQENVNGWFYALGVLKTTKSNPFELTNVRMDLDEPTLYPTDTNKIDYGLFNKCMFADSMIRHDNKWYLYYGAGDMYVGLATARGDFSAGAAKFNLDGNIITASTMALNKKYGNDKSAYEIDFVARLYDLEGNLIYEEVVDYSIDHFTHLEMGKYANGQEIVVSLDLSTIPGLPEDYYISCYVIDTLTGEVINNISTYVEITSIVTSTAK